jgi:hypothetical protein
VPGAHGGPLAFALTGSAQRTFGPEVLAAQPLEAGPVRVEEPIPWKAADVVEAAIGTSVLDQRGAGPLADAPGGLTTCGAILAGPEARPAAAEALFTFVPVARDLLRGLLRGTR